MKLTLSLLKKYLETNATAQEISDKLNSIGHEVEELTDKSEIYKPFIIAEVVDAEKHPQADKLTVCKVNNGKEVLQVVCGAPNARKGIKVVLAPVSAVIPANGLVIKASKIRSVDSNGMLCSNEELMLDGNSDGIIELPADAVVGTEFYKYAGLDDVIFELAITPNRGDATSVLGIARDLAATGIGTLKTPTVTKPKEAGASKINVSIEDTENCYEFFGRYVADVKNCASPKEVTDFLKAIGSTPKSALIDFSNFAMFALGRPSHIFDADKIEGTLHVRKSKAGEELLALNGELYKMPEGTTVVADDKKVLAIAGIIGGDASKVTDETKNIFIEMAHWNPANIAKDGRALNIITDARYRFERRVDHGIAELFMDYITNLVTDHCGGTPSALLKVKGGNLDYITSVEFDHNYIEKLSGLKVDLEKCKSVLAKLGFEYDGKTVKIPTYRQGDIVGQADIVEEVLRIIGLDQVPNMALDTSSIKWREKSFIDKARVALSSRGMSELVTWSFMSEKFSEIFGFNDSIKIKNPISSELSVMRQSIIPNLVSAAQQNYARSISNFSLFEASNIYRATDNLRQSVCIAGIRVGESNPKSVYKDSRAFDFYDVKADVFTLIELYGLDPNKLMISADAPSYYHPGKSCSLKLGKNLIGYVGQLSPRILKHYDLLDNVVGFEIFASNLPELKVKHARASYIANNFQPVTRDFAFIVAEKTPIADFVKTVKSVNQNLIEDVAIFDIFAGKNIEAGKKSVALSVLMQPKEKTLSEEEISTLCQDIINTVSIKLQASLR
jgi:phenylalanyl-tRNA synthetase beta chain